jgi:hypothetical protein
LASTQNRSPWKVSLSLYQNDLTTGIATDEARQTSIGVRPRLSMFAAIKTNDENRRGGAKQAHGDARIVISRGIAARSVRLR